MYGTQIFSTCPLPDTKTEWISINLGMHVVKDATELLYRSPGYLKCFVSVD